MTETSTASETPGCELTEGRHLFGKHCPDCMAYYLSTVSLETVDLWFEHGMITGSARDAYRHVWAISAVRSKTYDHWMAYPDTEEARYIAKVLVELIPGGRGYC